MNYLSEGVRVMRNSSTGSTWNLPRGLGIARVLSWILILSVILGILVSCKSKKTELIEERERAIPVKVMRAREGELRQTVDFDAAATYKNVVPVAFKVAGKVKRVYVEEGDRVERGEVLAELDDSDYQNKLKLAEAALAAAEANYQALKALRAVQVSQAEADLKRAEQALRAAEAQLQLAKANLEQAKRDLQRMQTLYSQGAISLQNFEMAKLRFKSAQSAYKAALSSYNQVYQAYLVAKHAPNRVKATDEQLRAAEASVQRARASLQDVRKLLRDLVLVSPSSGIVVERKVEEGMVVGPGVPLFFIGTSSEIVIRGKISDSDASKLKVGLRGTARWNDLTFPVEIIKIYPDLKAIGLKQVELKPISSVSLDHGDYLRVSLPYRSYKGILIKREALMLSPEGYFLFVVENGVAKRRKVKVLAQRADKAVVQGIKTGELVVIEGQFFLSDGVKVKVKDILD